MSLKILFISHKFFPDIGGIEINSEVLGNAFAGIGHQVKMLTWSEDPSDKKFPFEIIRNPDFLTIIRAHQWAEVVFENNPCLRLSWPAVLFKNPTVVALNTWITRTNGELGVQDKIKLKWLRRAKKVIAVSDALRKQCYSDATVIGNPYNKDVFRVLPEVKKTKDFVVLGRLVSDKGADQAIHALHLLNTLKEEGKGYTLTIIGDGPEKSSLETLAKKYQLEQYITFTGSLRGESLVSCLNEHKFILIPSVWEEPFGNVALEGMACGCIPIASDGGGLPDAVGKAGLLFERGNISALVDSIKNIVENPELDKTLRNAAPSHLAAHHPERVAQQYLSVITKAFSN